MLRIKFTYFNMAQPTNNPMNKDYYFASEALDYQNIYWEPRIVDPFEIERFFDVQSDTTNRIRTVQVTLDNSDGFLNQFMTKTTTFLNNFMTLYYDNGNGVTKSFTGKVQSIDGVSSTVRLTLREFGYEYLENTFPDAQIAYDYYSDSGINDSWNCIPIHFGVVKRIPLSWVNSFYSEFIIGSGPILSVDKVYIDDEVIYDINNPNQHYKPTEDSKEIYVRIFRGRGWDADGKRETVVDQVHPDVADPTRETISGNNVTHISQWGGFAYIQLYSIEERNIGNTNQKRKYEVQAYPYNTDGALGQVYVDIHGIVKINKTGTNTYSYTNTMVQNPAEIIKLMFCQPELVSEGPCAIGWGYKESDVDFAQAIKDCGPNETINGEEIQHLNFVIDGSFDTSGQFGEALKVILQCCRGYIVEENGKITLKIDKARDINTPVVEFDEEGITGFDCNLEEWNEPDLDSQTNRIRLNYDWSQEFKRYNKKPDANHESPDYKEDPDYDTWLIDQAHCEKVQKWNTEELELKMVSDTTTAHRLAIYYLRKKSFQHIQGTLSCANSAAMNLDAGDLIGIKSKQFNWYKNDTGGTDPNKGKVFQITSIKKGDELTDIDFIEYDPAIFIADTLGFNLHEIPSKIENLIKPATPTSLTLQSVSKEYAGTTICEINGTVVYASNSNKLFATVRYFDYGTSTPANDYTPPSDANWITYGNVDSNKFTISGLTPGHWYFIQVYTVNANGSSEPIVNKVKSLGDIIPPGIPTVSHTFTSGRSIGVKIELLNPPTDFRGFMLFKDGTYLTSITTNIHQNKATCEYTDVCEKYKTTYKYKATSYDKWNNISQYSTEIDITTPEDIDLDDITGTIEILQDDIADTNTRIDEYVSDDVLSVGEKSRLAEDWLAIRDSRYNKVKTEAENHYFHAAFSVYNQDYLDFVDAYEELEAYVDGNGSTINLTPTPPAVLTESRIEGVGSTIKKKFSDYYDLEIKVLSDIDKDNKNRASTIYAECHTEANVASKWVILPDVVIFTGLRLCVKFFNGNTSPGVITLNIKRNVSDESGLITGGKLYHNSGFAIPVITFEAGTTITLVLTEKTEVINEVDTIVQAWEFSDSSILGLGEQELSLGNKTFNLGMVNGNRIIAETVDTQQLNAQAVTSEKITSEQIFGKDFRTSEDVGETVDDTIIAGIKFNANGIFGYNTLYQSIAINASDGSVRIGSDSVYMSFNQANGLKVVGNISGSSGIIGDVVLDSNGLHSNTIDSTTQQTIYSLGNTGLIARRGNIAGWTITDTSLDASGIHLRSNGLIYGGNYASGVSGWRIDQLGNAEFNSATIRGKIQTAVFEYNKVSAIGGQMLLKRASIVVSDSTHVNTATTLYVKDANEFSVGDCFFVKDPEEVIGGTFYGIISAVDTTNNVLTYSIPDDAGAFFSPANGQSVVNYGNPMSGGIMFDGNSPYIDIFKNHTVSLERDYNIYDPILNINAWDSTTASIAEEDGVIDISGEDNNGQAFGGVSVVNDKVMGRCFYFDETANTYVKTESQTLFNKINGKTALTLSIRIKKTGTNNDVGGLANTTGHSFGTFTFSNSSISFNDRLQTGDTIKTVTAPLSDINDWHTFTVVMNYEIGVCKLYVDGIEVVKDNNWFTGEKSDVVMFMIGAEYYNPANLLFTGSISEYKIFDKALTQEEVQIIYKQSLVTPYINSNMYEPILNLDADYSTTASIAVADGVIDVSGNHNNGQAYGGVEVVQDAEIGDCFMFKGAGEGVEKIKIAENFINSDYLTLFIRIKNRGLASRQNLNVVWHGAGIELDYYDQNHATNPSKFFVGVYIGGTRYYLISQNTLILDGNWHTATMSFDGEKLKFYFDGILNEEQSISGVRSNTYLPYIGAFGNGANYDLNAYIADVRVYSRALSATEIYNVYQQLLNPEAFENPEKLISYDEINVHHFSGDAIQLDHLVRLGNLNGIADITDDRYGIFLGDERSYLKYDSVDGLKLINSNFALDGSILSDNFLWIDGNGNLHDDINMEIASDVDKGITNGQRYTEEGSMLNMTSGAFVTPNVRFDNRGSFYTKSKAFFENPDNVSTFFDVKYTTIESKGNIVLYDYQDNYEDSTSPYEEGPGTIAMFTLGNKNTTTGLRNLSGIKLNGSLNTNGIPTMMTFARTTGTTVDDNGNVSSYTINKSSTVSHPYWLPVIQMSNLIYDNNTDKTDLYVDASVYPTALTGSNKTLNLGSSAYRWSTFYSNYGDFSNVAKFGYDYSKTSSIPLVMIGCDDSYGRGIRLHPDLSGHSGILFGGNDLTSITGTSANSFYMTAESGGSFKLYKNTTIKLACGTDGNWTMNGSLTNSSGFIGNVTGNCSGSSGSCTGNAASSTISDKVTGSYTSNGGQQNPNYFGKNKVGFLMMNTTVNSNSQYKDWILMDCYSGNDVGGGVAFGVNRQALGAYIMRSAKERTSWAESAELIGTHNYTSYTVKKDGTGASGSWGISVTGSSASCTGNAATATTATNANNAKLTHTVGNTEYPLVFGSSFVITDAQQALRIGTPTATLANCALRCKAYCAAANTQGEAYLVMGNNLAKASANNARGGLTMYGTGAYYLHIRAGDVTANRVVNLVGGTADVTLTLPSATGTLALTSSNITGSSASCTGNAATATTAENVTGTVAIANGGTGATTRLNALKALTNESVGANATFFLTITNSWGKGGYTSVADAKTVLGIKNFVKSGSSAADGLVPKPATTAGTTKFLCEDATWKTIPAASLPFTNGMGTATAEISTPNNTWYTSTTLIKYVKIGELLITFIMAAGQGSGTETFPVAYKYTPFAVDIAAQANITKISKTSLTFSQTNWAWAHSIMVIGVA